MNTKNVKRYLILSLDIKGCFRLFFLVYLFCEGGGGTPTVNVSSFKRVSKISTKVNQGLTGQGGGGQKSQKFVHVLASLSMSPNPM